MPERARLGVLISGTGSNMAALLYASRLPGNPYEVVLVASNNPTAPGLALAAAEGVPTFAHDHRGIPRADFDALIDRRVDARRCHPRCARRLHAAPVGRLRRPLDGAHG